MTNPLFSNQVPTIRKTFGFVPTLNGSQKTALNSAVEHFVGISTIMSEGGVTPELSAFAIEKLYEAKLAVDAAIAYGWNGGKNY